MTSDESNNWVELPSGILMHQVPVYEQDWPVMALTVNKKKKEKKYEGIIREIVKREGNVGISGFLDRSKLFIVESEDLLTWKKKEELSIQGIGEIISSLQKENMEFIGLEDPDISIEHDTTHVFFTIAFKIVDKIGEYAVYLGHAQGKDISELKATPPVLSPNLAELEKNYGFKEVAINETSHKEKRMHLCESGYLDKEHDWGVSTIALVESDKNLKNWKFIKHVAGPKNRKISWCAGHLSPGPFLPKEFARTDNLRVCIINGRSKNARKGKEIIYGDFTVGLALFNPQTGEIPWISPEPMIKDPDAKTITFASDYIQVNKNEILLYAHVDDSFVRAYRIKKQTLTNLLPKNI